MEFHYFPKLPIELREEIWKLALPGPRFIDVVVSNINTYRLDNEEKAPNMFFACREARFQVLKRYRPFRGTEPKAAVIYCDFECDILLIGGYFRKFSRQFLDTPRFGNGDLHKEIRRVAVSYGNLVTAGNGSLVSLVSRQIEGIFSPYKGLKEVLVFRDPREMKIWTGKWQWVVEFKEFMKLRGRPSSERIIASLQAALEALEGDSKPVLRQGFVNIISSAKDISVWCR